MKSNWDPSTYDAPRRRLVPCYPEFYGTFGELISRTAAERPRILDLGAGTGLLSAEVLKRVDPGSVTLQDVSASMLEQAELRLKAWKPSILNLDFANDVAPGTYDVIMSALAIHHIADEAKQTLLKTVFERLAPGGVFINAEQVSHSDARGQRLFELMHLDRSRALGSADREIESAVKRMEIDRCAPAEQQVSWMRTIGFSGAAVYYQWFRFAVMAGWKPDTVDRMDELNSS